MTYQEQLDVLNSAYDRIAEANSILMANQNLGYLSYAGPNTSHPRTFSYDMPTVQNAVVTAMNSINHAMNSITDYVSQQAAEDAKGR